MHLLATMTSLQTRYVASRVLAGSGDALDYERGYWEFNESGQQIHKELAKLGGIDNINVTLPGWNVSDDTVMYLATAEALVAASNGDREQLYLQVCLVCADTRLRDKGILQILPESVFVLVFNITLLL